MNETVVFQKEYAKGFSKQDNSITNNSNLSFKFKGVILWIINQLRMNPGMIMTKKKFMELTGESRWETDKIFAEAEANGFVNHIKILPHQQTDDESPYSVNHWIQHWYTWYEAPEDNKKFKKEKYKESCREKRQKKKMLSNVNDEFQIKYETTQIVNPTEIKKEQEVKVDNIEQTFYQEAKRKFDKSIFKENIDEDPLRVSKSDIMTEFVDKEVSADIFTNKCSTEDLIFYCWNLIVRASSFTEKSYESFRFNKQGNEMANDVSSLLMQRYNTVNIYSPMLSNIEGIKNNITTSNGAKLNKLLLFKFSEVIANFVELGYLRNKDNKKRIPTLKEVILLYETMEANPELIGLGYSVEQYNIFCKFYMNTLHKHGLE